MKGSAYTLLLILLLTAVSEGEERRERARLPTVAS
jgi:hypothetical protein